MQRLLVLLSFIPLLAACWEVGGANTQESVRGNADQGNLIGYQLIVGEDGRHLIATGAEGQGVYSVDLQRFSSVPLQLDFDAMRMVFAEGDRAYFAGKRQGASEGIGVVEELSLETGERLGRWSIPGETGIMTYDARTDRIALWWYGSKRIVVLTPRSGDLEVVELERVVIDVRWLPRGELAVVETHEWREDTPETRVTLLSPSGDERRFIVPNCASRLVLAPAGDVALLAPTDCRKDPVSVIDLARGAFLENLPGFGPVAFSDDGTTAIAFGRQQDLANLGIETATPYSLLFIDTRDWSIETLDIGDALPLYSLTPDGEVVLVFSIFESASYDGIFLIDIATKTIRETSGPEVSLLEYVVTPDSRLVYLIEGGLFRLDVQTGEISYVTLDCGGVGEPARCNPELVNMLPDGETLILGWINEPEYALFDIAAERISRTFVVGQGAPGTASLAP